MRARAQRRDPAIERAHFEAVVEARGRLYWADRTPAGIRRREIRSALLAGHSGVQAGDAVLEIGCGTGEYTRVLAPLLAGRLVGIDVAPAVAAHAGEAVGTAASVAAADVERLPFAAGTFAAVVGNAVLHHLRLDQALAELYRVIRPGGRLCFAEPNLLNPHVFVERTVPFVGRWLDDSPGETAFTRWGLGRQVASAGFVEVYVRPFDFLYPLVPGRWVPAVERLGRQLERVAGVREIAGSLLVTARRPPTGAPLAASRS